MVVVLKLILVTCSDSCACDFHVEAMRVVWLVFGTVATEQDENKLCCSEEVSIFETDQENEISPVLGLCGQLLHTVCTY